jgi:hypothetical protein
VPVFLRIRLILEAFAGFVTASSFRADATGLTVCDGSRTLHPPHPAATHLEQIFPAATMAAGTECQSLALSAEQMCPAARNSATLRASCRAVPWDAEAPPPIDAP